MPYFEIIPGKLRHCGAIARAARVEHRLAISALGYELHREVRTIFAETLAPKAWLIDGQLAALGGVAGGPLLPSGILWLVLSEAATRFPVVCIREAKRQIEEGLHTRHELTACVVSGDKAALRFALYLGFEYDSAPMGRDRRVIYMRYRRLAMQAA